jgi:hypothetical protein
MVPQVEEVGREPEFLTLVDLEVLQHGKVPVLLERTAVDVTAEISKIGGAEVSTVCLACGWVNQRRWSECRRIQVAV